MGIRQVQGLGRSLRTVSGEGDGEFPTAGRRYVNSVALDRAGDGTLGGYAEKVLYSYRLNKEREELLKAEIAELAGMLDVRGQNYSPDGVRQGKYTDPVASRYERIEAVEGRLKLVSKRVRAVEALREDLRIGCVDALTGTDKLLLLLEGYYMEQVPAKEFLRRAGWLRSVFYARRRELVMLAGEYLREDTPPRVKPIRT